MTSQFHDFLDRSFGGFLPFGTTVWRPRRDVPAVPVLHHAGGAHQHPRVEVVVSMYLNWLNNSSYSSVHTGGRSSQSVALSVSKVVCWKAARLEEKSISLQARPSLVTSLVPTSSTEAAIRYSMMRHRLVFSWHETVMWGNNPMANTKYTHAIVSRVPEVFAIDKRVRVVFCSCLLLQIIDWLINWAGMLMMPTQSMLSSYLVNHAFVFCHV